MPETSPLLIGVEGDAMDEQAILKDVRVAFEYSYLHDDWVNPLDETLAGISVEHALWRPGDTGKNIWEIVLHMAVWNENTIERVNTGEKASPKEGNWPEFPANPDQAAWEAAKRRLWESMTAVQNLLETKSLKQIQDSPYGLPDLFCRMIHNGYHIGQITKMREMLRI